MKRSPFGCDPTQSRGRRIPEPKAPTRTEFQRDRDRIVHSTAFRRLVYKTQVFLNHEGDLFRTRLTHSLEVAQLGRSIARNLGLDEDLVETIALAHDLGHTPFGHVGQDVLNECMRDHGGFEHNLQSLRVVDTLELRYPTFDGLNLTFESREGILKHCSKRNAAYIESIEPDGVASRFLRGSQSSLEAQLCNLADEIAYNAHDIDDGVRAGLINFEQLLDVTLVKTHFLATLSDHPKLNDKRLLFEVIRRMLSALVYDIIDTSRELIAQSGVCNVQEVRASAVPLIAFSPAAREKSRELKRFLFANLYRHRQVLETRARAEQVIRELFSCFRQRTDLLPSDLVERSEPARACADYIAGMTDRFAIKEHYRLTGTQLF